MEHESRRSRRKRSREGEDEIEKGLEEEAPRTKKTGVFQSLIGSMLGGSNDAENSEEEVGKSIPPVSPGLVPLSMTDQERSALISNKIDEHHFAMQAEEADKLLRDPKRKLAWKPDISPDDDDWKEFFDKMNGELREYSVLKVLDDSFEEGQKVMILPPSSDGAIIEIQEENTKQYKESLTEGGKFHGKAHDNMTTKLTMLHFGLPVEPMSRNNIFRAGRFPDEDDPPDEDLGPERYERIYYASKPLDFLDTYWERSYGHKIIRRSPPRDSMSMRGGVGSLDEISHPSPIYSQMHGSVGQNGGAGKPSYEGDVRMPDKGKYPVRKEPIRRVRKDTTGDDDAVDGLVAPIGPRDNFNRERILKQRAAEIKLQKYDPWLAEQRRQDRLQRESYHTDHRAVVPGQKPEPPLFGMTRELMLSVSDALPTIYSHRLTPTDINAILEENQNSRNRILERMDACPLCPKSFPKYKDHELQAHLRKHGDQIASAGKCPVCETEQWAMMDMQQKKRHVAFHQVQQKPWKQDYETDRKFYWDIEHCPICGIKFEKLGATEDVIYHLAEHPQGMLRFCDRCGLEKAACSNDELKNHKSRCIDAPERLEDDPEMRFCEVCNTNRTNETDEGRLNHRMICDVTKCQYYCRKCGLNMTDFSVGEKTAHINRCKPVRGWKGKYCQRCGEDLSGYNGEQRRTHLQETCSFNNKYKPSQQESLEEMKKMVERQEELLAKSQAEASEARANYTRLHVEQKDGVLGKCLLDSCPVSLAGMSSFQVMEHMKRHGGQRIPDISPKAYYSPQKSGSSKNTKSPVELKARPPAPVHQTYSESKTAQQAKPTTKPFKNGKATTKATTKPAAPKPKTAKSKGGREQESEDEDSEGSDFQPNTSGEKSRDNATRGGKRKRVKKYKKRTFEDGTWEYYTDPDDDEPSDVKRQKLSKPRGSRDNEKLYKKTDKKDKDGSWIYVTDVSDEEIPSADLTSDYTDGGTRIPKGTRGERAKAEKRTGRKPTRRAANPKVKAAEPTKAPVETERPRKQAVDKTKKSPGPVKAPESTRRAPPPTTNDDEEELPFQQGDTDNEDGEDDYDDDDEDDNKEVKKTERPPKRAAAKAAKKSNKTTVEDEVEDGEGNPFNAGQYEYSREAEAEDSDAEPDSGKPPPFTKKSIIVRKKSVDVPSVYRKLSDIPVDMLDELDEEDMEVVNKRLEKRGLSPRWIRDGKIIPHYSATKHSLTENQKPTSPEVKSKLPGKKPVAGGGAIRAPRVSSRATTTTTASRSTRVTKPVATAQTPARNRTNSDPISAPKTGRGTGRGRRRKPSSVVPPV